MLDEFMNEQKVAHRILTNSIIKNKCSHAYLIETNGYLKKIELAKAFAKYLLCPNNYSNNQKCVNCTQCENIDKNIFGELKIIEPDGMWIKKEQLLELQEEFKMKSVLANKKVYIITDATKLNPSSSNSILKFLEEPSDNIVAILLADNIHQLLDTIVSRCQVITLNKILQTENKLESLLSVNIENLDLVKETSVNFINEIEKQKEKTILYTKKLFHNNIQDKNELIVSFEIMILYYKDAINEKLNRKLELFDNVNMLTNNDIEELNRKIKVITNLKNKIYVNANTNLLVDKLILELGGTYENSRYSI